MLTACVMTEVQYRGGEYEPTEKMSAAIVKVAQWLTEMSKVGMLLCGTCGNGKTTLMRAVRTLYGYVGGKDAYGQSLNVYEVSAREIARMCSKDYDNYHRHCKLPMLAIDDLGLEPTEVLDYGNVFNPTIELLTRRYDEQLFTLITTNLSPRNIREKYGDRIADRFNEMFDRVIFTDKSFRR